MIRMGCMRVIETIRVLLADDHALFRECLRECLQRSPSIDVVGEAEDGKMAVELTRQLLPDLAMMDLDMPVMDGVEATRLIKRELPGVKVIVLTSFNNRAIAIRALKAGASAFLVKGCNSVEIVSAIKTAIEDDHYGIDNRDKTNTTRNDDLDATGAAGWPDTHNTGSGGP
jgi:DNA-binding NarL/FixJ family response regulator